ncbi:hypothetical protein M404DRAFT_5962 [Pisolithus tinctorius Marx 270]|uniref:Uncharacterized protein n=1 Tax=Pisolithus tinctorius Marx 270 TaxID=870435 RepID=A0A0C3PL19_PISTI|nr:hypothetical protein M404DRAFT_5962 [Pisolithus tinctorius Marx 270]
MNHAIIPKSYNPHLFTRHYELTSRAEHTKHSSVLAEPVQDEETDSLKRKLDQLLHATWDDVAGDTHSCKTEKRRKMEMDKSDGQGELCRHPSSTIPTRSDEFHTTVFRLLSSTNGPQLISLKPKPPPPTHTQEPEWEDNTSKAEERRQRAESIAVEYDDQWLRVSGDQFPVPLPSIGVIEKSRMSTRSRPRPDHRKAVSSHVPASSPHELKTTCVSILPAQTIPTRGTAMVRSSRRRRRRKVVHERTAPAYWKPPASLRGKCMGYALGYPGGWGHAGVPGRGYIRDSMKKGVLA